jgi:hypothetical protein
MRVEEHTAQWSEANIGWKFFRRSNRHAAPVMIPIQNISTPVTGVLGREVRTPGPIFPYFTESESV